MRQYFKLKSSFLPVPAGIPDRIHFSVNMSEPELVSAESVEIDGVEGSVLPLNDTDRYEQNLRRFREKISSNKGKFNLILAALDHGEILPDPLNVALKKIKGKQGESDFQIISLVRLLFLGDDAVPAIVAAKADIMEALATFSFWPENAKSQPSFDKIVFWSENHLFMTLGSCYLYNQYKLAPKAQSSPAETKKVILGELDKALTTKLLKIYLRAHCAADFNGLYEVNSSVYLPYTLSGLFNLYDFALDEEIKHLAHTIIDRVVFHVMLCTTSRGVSNLCAGGRTFLRTRLRTHDHNINQLTNALLGQSPDEPSPSAITDYILTTTWRPNLAEVQRLVAFTGAHPRLQLSHPVHLTRELYLRLAQEEGLEDQHLIELVPFYWSAGLVTHPDYVSDTRAFQKQKGMHKNEHLSALSYESMYLWGSMQGSMARYSTISKGQMYTDIELNVFKHPQQELLLSSFERFNPHCASFQQLPWIANVSGVGVWTQAGTGSDGFLNFGMTNTHNPVITQKGSLLIASYVTPAALTNRMIMGSLFSGSVRLYWPIDLFSEWVCFRAPTENVWVSNQSPAASNPMVMHSTVAKLNDVVQKTGTWSAARRGQAYVAVYCSQRCKMDHRPTKDAAMQESKAANIVHASRRVCDAYRHSWVVVVGSTRDYPSLQAFVDARCLQMQMKETNGGGGMFEGARKKYEFSVTDPVEGQLTNTVALPT